MKQEGEILIAMDANAKIGLLGEEISRNGKLILNVFLDTKLDILNRNTKCEGTVTRKNTKNANEISAIDFVVASDGAEQMVTAMTIDENELYKIRGKNDTDHITICIDLNLYDLNKTKVTKKTDWNMRASNEKWALFGEELTSRQTKTEQIITNKNESFEVQQEIQ